MSRVREHRQDEFAYIHVVVGCREMVPLIALHDQDDMLFIRVKAKTWGLIVGWHKDVDPQGVTELFGLPILHERSRADASAGRTAA